MSRLTKKKFYLIGIAGVAMASLAGLLKKKGYEVVGSDQDVYPPMSDMLRSLKIPIFKPYNGFHLKHHKPDIVVVGNAIGRGNPELEYVISNGLLPAGRQVPYRSMSDILRGEFIEGKKAIVITDRKEAIKKACRLAKPGDIILVSGKGHEKYQIIKGIKYHFDDLEELRKNLNI